MKKIFLFLFICLGLVRICQSQTVKFGEPFYLDSSYFKLPIVVDSIPSDLCVLNLVFTFDTNKFELIAFGGLVPIPKVSSLAKNKVNIFWENNLIREFSMTYKIHNLGCGDFIFDKSLSFAKDFCDNFMFLSFETISVCGNEFNERNLVIYPNPSNGIFFWETKMQISKIKIFDFLGKEIFISQKNTGTLDLADKSKGMYFVHFISDENSFVKKIINR